MPREGVQLTRVLKVRPARVFRAWTRPELMARWFYPGEGWVCSVRSDLTVGGSWEVVMTDAEGRKHTQYGVYREIVPDSRLVFTWNCPDLNVANSVVTLELRELERGTELTLTHELPADPNVRRGHEEGWEGCLRNLAKHLLDTEGGEHMSSIHDEITIDATAVKVYEALATQAGYRGWWNTVAEVPEAVGGEAQLRFVKDGNPVNMRYRIDELRPNQSVRWTCIAHDMPSWVGTTLEWRLRDAGGKTLVAFEHAGWTDPAPVPVVQGWKHFLGSLKSYVETGTGQPW